MSDAVVSLPDAEHAHVPRARLTGREWRTALELASAAVNARHLDDWPHGDGHPVLVLPGFMAGPESTVFLRGHLRKLGYEPRDWGHGRNYGASPALLDHLRDTLLETYDRYGRAVTLIGWSAGGIYAREMARDSPHYVRGVITLGSPFRGNLQATRAWRFYRFMNRGDHTEELTSEEARALRAEPLTVPTTCIYSKNDGIVAWECCTSLPAPLTENVEVTATHLGYGHHIPTLRIIADRLAQPEGQWQRYAGADPSPVSPVSPGTDADAG